MEIVNIPWFDIKPRPVSERRQIPALIEIYRDHILLYGMMNPLVVTPDKEFNWGYTLISGQNAYWAARAAGLEMIPCLITP